MAGILDDWKHPFEDTKLSEQNGGSLGCAPPRTTEICKQKDQNQECPTDDQ